MEVYITILVLNILFAVLVHHYKIKKQKDLQLKGLVNISHIKALISLIQSHRGLSSAWLHGDESKKNALLVLEQKASSEINYLKEQTEIIKNSRWGAFADHWGRLVRLDSSRDPSNNFKQHTQLVANLLYLLEDEAEHSRLHAMALPAFESVGFVWRELVTTTESIGQSRAIGTGVATSKYCSSVDKIRLSFLQENIQKTMNETLAQLSSLPDFTTRHTQLLKIATTKIEFFTKTIEDELITANEITINQDDYFALATDSISSLDDIFSLQMEQIKRII